MYSQGLIGADTKTHEDAAFLAAFQKRIDAEEKIEPNDPMPEGYRKTLVRQISQHAHSEVVGMLPTCDVTDSDDAIDIHSQDRLSRMHPRTASSLSL